jgi:hypothetical protein
MARDFLASQIRTNQIIASRSLGSLPSILVISSSIADGLGGISGPALGAGADTFLFISGSRASNAFTVLGGSAKISGSLTVFDNTTLGASTADIINFTGRIGSNIVPVTTDDFSIGAPLLKWSAIFASTGTFDNISVSSDAKFANGLSGSLQQTSGGLPYLVAGTDITISTSSVGQITISSTAAAGASNWNELSPSPRLNTTASVAIAGGLGSSFSAQNAGSDVFFFVTGSNATRVSLFGGNLIASGNLVSKNSAGSTVFVATTAGVISASSNILGGANIITSGTLTVSGGLINFNNNYGSNLATIEETSAGDLEIRNRYTGGTFVSSVRTSSGNTVNFLRVVPNGFATESTVAFLNGIYAGAANPIVSADTNFFVGGVRGSKDGSNKGTAVFAGDVVTSGSLHVGAAGSDILVINANLASDIIPSVDMERNLGSQARRFANVYTGDLHLRNDRGDYTLIEEEDCLTIRFNKTGKRYKFVLEPAPEYDEQDK